MVAGQRILETGTIAKDELIVAIDDFQLLYFCAKRNQTELNNSKFRQFRAVHSDNATWKMICGTNFNYQIIGGDTLTMQFASKIVTRLWLFMVGE